MSATWIVLFIALWVVVVTETVLVLGLSRRFAALESARTSVVAPGGGTKGAVPPGTHLPREAAERLAIRSTDASRGTSVVLFLSPGCGPCLKLGDALRAEALGRDAGDDFEIIVVTSHTGAERFGHIGRTVVDSVGTLAKSLSVPGTPFAFAVDSQGIICGIGLPNVVDDVRKLADARPPSWPDEATSLAS